MPLLRELHVSSRGDTALWSATRSSKTEQGHTEAFFLMLETIVERDINDFIQDYHAEKIVAGKSRRVSSAIAAILIERGLTHGFALPDSEDI